MRISERLMYGFGMLQSVLFIVENEYFVQEQSYNFMQEWI